MYPFLAGTLRSPSKQGEKWKGRGKERKETSEEEIKILNEGTDELCTIRNNAELSTEAWESTTCSYSQNNAISSSHSPFLFSFSSFFFLFTRSKRTCCFFRQKKMLQGQPMRWYGRTSRVSWEECDKQYSFNFLSNLAADVSYVCQA